MCTDQFKDEVARIALIWIPMAVFKEATGRYFVGSDLLLDPYLTVGYGYLAAVLMTTVGRYVAVKLMTLIDSRVFKTAVEEVYVGISSVLTIALWKGMGAVFSKSTTRFFLPARRSAWRALCRRAVVSVCPSVCLSHDGIVSKRLNLS